ncbi:MAG: glutamate synthase [Candidatus Zixiibacteriota bacterium]|nr:MAG: glutamate synthase [candidate division Zixibacteria bacterium]
MNHDVLVVGGGIAGMESSLTLGDMGYNVLLVEKEASIGGKMVLLSKVFPTLDCASCISTPKMASTAHHPNITISTSSEIDEIIKKDGGSFKVRLHKKSTYVNSAACTGCGECELACTVARPDPFNFDLTAHRAIHIPFPQAVPKKAVMVRKGTSPCSFSCPAGVKAHGYVSLVRSGKYEEAFRLHMEDAPLPGSLSRACYAPCESDCTRGELEGTVPIRAIKRFMVDHYYEKHPEPEYGPPETLLEKKIAVVGSGPAGLSAAYHLARHGYRVTVFESATKPGGMLRYGIPAYRLPNDVVDRDIKNITALGVCINTESPVSSLESLKDQGFDATFLALGTSEGMKMSIEGEDLNGVTDCMSFLKQANSPDAMDLSGKTVMVIGGGNAAIDPARTAIRLGAKEVIIQYRRSRAEMPAHNWEVTAALEEGVTLQALQNPVRFVGSNGSLEAVESITMKLGEPDDSGRRRPIPISGSEQRISVDLAILAIGLKPSTSPFARELELNRNGTIQANEETFQTSVNSVFAGGDAVTGPSMIVSAIGHGKRAAFYIDRLLKGEALDGITFDSRLPAVEASAVLSRANSDGGENGNGSGHQQLLPVVGLETPRAAISERTPTEKRELPVSERIKSMAEVEIPFTEEEARYGANRCLDCGVCSECNECVRVCPANAIDFSLRDEEQTIEVKSVIVSTGFNIFDAHRKPTYGYGKFPNVITAMQMDRILAPTRPYNGVIRPSDGKAPDNIAYVLCAGSRDQSVDNILCSRVCCMYSIKQAQLVMGSLPLADITIYYIDIRAFGKGYDEFYQQARGMGVYFVKGRVAQISELDTGNLDVQYEAIGGDGGLKHADHDLVVLSTGFLPNPDALRMFKNDDLEADTHAYVREIDEDINPGRTSIDGVFVAGAASAPRDIPDSILHSGAAAAQTAAYIERMRTGQ